MKQVLFLVLALGWSLVSPGADAGVETALDNARALASEGRLEDATRELHRALEEYPENAELMFAVGEISRQAGSIREATRWWGKVLQKDPGFWKAHYNLGIAFSRRREGLWDLQAACGHFEAVLDVTPEHPGAHAHLAQLYLRRTEYERAAREAQEALRLAPERFDMEYIRAEVARRQGDLAGGIRILQEAVGKFYDKRMLRGYLASFLALSAAESLEQKDYRSAWQKYSEAVRQDSGNQRIWDQFLKGAADSGDAEGILMACELYAERFPENPEALNALAYALAERGERLADAEQLASKAVDRAGGTKQAVNLPVYFDTLGWIRHLRGDNALALFNLNLAEKALAPGKVKTRATILYHRACVQEASGSVAAARGDYEEALELAGEAPELQALADSCRQALGRLR